MKLPEHSPSMSDRASTREELFEILELIGPVEEPQGIKQAPTCERFASLEANRAATATEILEDVGAGEERFFIDVESLDSLFGRKGQRIN
jgi:hypothetical protein